MARITRVKAAQQRYATVPVLDDQGNPVVRTMTNRRTGEPKVTKRGRVVTQRVTREDRTKPLDPYRCDYPGCTITDGLILPGQAYMWIKPKSGPYGGRRRNRHAEHPAWQVWDYSYSLSAQTARIAHDFREAVDGADDPDDVTEALNAAAESIRELAEGKREGAENIRSGFGHDTSTSDDLDQVADDLESWADEVENAEVPDLDEYQCSECDEGQAECPECGGSGTLEGEDGPEDCQECDGGQVECSYCSGDGTDWDAWREAVADAVAVVDECPV